MQNRDCSALSRPPMARTTISSSERALLFLFILFFTFFFATTFNAFSSFVFSSVRRELLWPIFYVFIEMRRRSLIFEWTAAETLTWLKALEFRRRRWSGQWVAPCSKSTTPSTPQNWSHSLFISLSWCCHWQFILQLFSRFPAISIQFIIPRALPYFISLANDN